MLGPHLDPCVREEALRLQVETYARQVADLQQALLLMRADKARAGDGRKRLWKRVEEASE